MVNVPIRAAVAAGAMVLAVVATPASAADIPCSTAKLIVPWAPGGETDVVFRIFADTANKQGAKPQLQVVNIAGQGGNKGAKEARAAKPDGCTVFAIHQSAITSYFTDRVDFTWDAFEPVILLTRTPAIIGANVKTPYKSAKELQGYAKANPQKVLAGATLGSTSHFVFMMFEDAAQIRFKYVPYEGTAERMTALLAGNIDMGEITLAAAKKYIQTNELKAIGIAADERDPNLPDLPTLKEQGINMTFATDRGIVAPKGTKPDVVNHYIDVFKKAATEPEVVRHLRGIGTVIPLTAGAGYRKYFEDIFAKWKQVAKDLGEYKRKDG